MGLYRCIMPSRSGISGSARIFTRFLRSSSGRRGSWWISIDVFFGLLFVRLFRTHGQGTIHWDADPRGPEEPSVQAVVLLTDVNRDGGGFQCLPEIYRNLDAWLRTHASKDDFNFFEPELNHMETTQTGGKAGDVILWSTQLPHGSAVNLSARPRMAAFVTLEPPADYEQLRYSLMTWWLTKRAPSQWRGMPGQIEERKSSE